MKVADINQKAQVIQYVNQQARVNAADKNQGRQQAGPVSSPVDRVELSSDSRMIQKIREAAQAAPDVRAEKVAALKKQVQAGTYRVSSEEIAGKMMKDILVEMNK